MHTASPFSKSACNTFSDPLYGALALSERVATQRCAHGLNSHLQPQPRKWHGQHALMTTAVTHTRPRHSVYTCAVEAVVTAPRIYASLRGAMRLASFHIFGQKLRGASPPTSPSQVARLTCAACTMVCTQGSGRYRSMHAHASRRGVHGLNPHLQHGWAPLR